MRFQLPITRHLWVVFAGLLALDFFVAALASYALYSAGQRVTVVATHGMKCTAYAPTIFGHTFAVAHCSEE
jgi:hypothetical protein